MEYTVRTSRTLKNCLLFTYLTLNKAIINYKLTICQHRDSKEVEMIFAEKKTREARKAHE